MLTVLSLYMYDLVRHQTMSSRDSTSWRVSLSSYMLMPGLDRNRNSCQARDDGGLAESIPPQQQPLLLTSQRSTPGTFEFPHGHNHQSSHTARLCGAPCRPTPICRSLQFKAPNNTFFSPSFFQSSSKPCVVLISSQSFLA